MGDTNNNFQRTPRPTPRKAKEGEIPKVTKPVRPSRRTWEDGSPILMPQQGTPYMKNGSRNPYTDEDSPYRATFDNRGYTSISEAARALRITQADILHAVRASVRGNQPRFERRNVTASFMLGRRRSRFTSNGSN